LSTIRINRGTTFVWNVNYSKDGEPATLTVRRCGSPSKPQSSPLTRTTPTLSSPATSLTATMTGTASWTLIPADTATLEPGTYFYDIKVEEAGGAVYKIDEGKIRLDGSPTNRLT
jgi:hypothetical protein